MYMAPANSHTPLQAPQRFLDLYPKDWYVNREEERREEERREEERRGILCVCATWCAVCGVWCVMYAIRVC